MCVFFVEFCVLIPIFIFLKNIQHKLFCYDNQHNAIQRIIFYLKNENVYHAFLVLGIKQSLDSVINKWKKLKQQYKTHLDKKRKSGTERGKNWKFFDAMNEVCGHRDTSSPACLFDSSMESIFPGM